MEGEGGGVEGSDRNMDRNETKCRGHKRRQQWSRKVQMGTGIEQQAECKKDPGARCSDKSTESETYNFSSLICHIFSSYLGLCCRNTEWILTICRSPTEIKPYYFSTEELLHSKSTHAKLNLIPSIIIARLNAIIYVMCQH